MDRQTTLAADAISRGREFVGMEHVDPGTGRISVGSGSRTGDGKGQAFLFDSRHILFGKLRPYLRKIAIPEMAGCSSTELVPLLPDPEQLDRTYLFHWVRRHQVIDTLMAKNTGARMPRADMSVLLGMTIPLPPLDGQRRIVGLLDRAAEIRRSADAARAKARAIIPALFLDIFGDPTTNPKGWPVAPFSTIVENFRYGTNHKCFDVSTDGALPVLRIPNVVGGSINWHDLKYAVLPEAEVKKLKMLKGDLLFVRTNGNPDYIGRCAVFAGEAPTAYASYLIRARLDEAMSSGFICQHFLHPNYRPMVLRSGQTTAGNYNLSVEGIGKLPVILPPRALQAAFDEQVHRLESLARHLDAAATKAEAMANGLSAEVFG